jgi:recombination protein RecR
MTEEFAPPVEELIAQFRRLPGVGKKSAQRLAFFVLGLPDAEAEAFASAILNAKKTVFQCSVCCNLTDREKCPVCEDEGRDRTTICVVADPKDVAAIERTREYKGTYHVLHGVISPLDDVSPDDIAIKELLARIEEGGIEEVIMATGSNVEGELTAMYISKLLKPLGVTVSRLAYGLRVGSDLQYADGVTLMRAIEGRRTI